MQCGTCSGSCPIGVQMDYGPRKTDHDDPRRHEGRGAVGEHAVQLHELLSLRGALPRGMPVTYILADLAAKSVEFGYAEGPHENRKFARSFWWTASWLGRTDERLVTMRYFFSLGFGEGVKRLKGNLKAALGLIKTGRLHVGVPHRVKDRKQLQAILAKAAEIEKRH